jgi:hypothetical protein
MNKATKKVKEALMARYKANSFVVPIGMRERPLRTQFRAFTKEAAAQARPMPSMDMTPPGMGADPMMAGQLLGQALDMTGMPDPMQAAQMEQEAAMQQQMAAMQPQMAAVPPPAGAQPMMAPEQLPAAPGAAQAQARVPAQAGPGINPQQILAALFGGR